MTYLKYVTLNYVMYFLFLDTIPDSARSLMLHYWSFNKIVFGQLFVDSSGHLHLVRFGTWMVMTMVIFICVGFISLSVVLVL